MRTLGCPFAACSGSQNMQELLGFVRCQNRNMLFGLWLWCGHVTGLFSAGFSVRGREVGKVGKGSLEARAGLSKHLPWA